MKRAIFQIGGGPLQIQTIAHAKAQGLAILLTDSSQSPIMLTEADEFACIDGTDVDALCDQAHKWSVQYDIVGVNCGSDFGLVSVSEICQKLGLPFSSPASVALALNKTDANKCFKKAKLPVPKAHHTPPADEDFPLIVKPADSSGSRGVSFVGSRPELANAVNIARSFSDKVVMEDWVDGLHTDVNGLLWHGTFLRGEMIERFFSPFPECYPLQVSSPPRSLTQRQVDKVWANVEAAVKALGLTHGPVKADLIVTNNEAYIIEAASRFHGETSNFSLDQVYGTTSTKLYLNALASGDAPDFSQLATPQKVAGWRAIFPEKAGYFKAVRYIDEAKAVPGVTNVIIRHPSAREIPAVRDNTALIGFIYGHAADHETLDHLLDQARETITVEME